MFRIAHRTSWKSYNLSSNILTPARRCRVPSGAGSVVFSVLNKCAYTFDIGIQLCPTRSPNKNHRRRLASSLIPSNKFPAEASTKSHLDVAKYVIIMFLSLVAR